MDVLKLEGYVLVSQKRKTENVSSCFETDVVWLASMAD